jgi:hypothetical protein
LTSRWEVAVGAEIFDDAGVYADVDGFEAELFDEDVAEFVESGLGAHARSRACQRQIENGQYCLKLNGLDAFCIPPLARYVQVPISVCLPQVVQLYRFLKTASVWRAFGRERSVHNS